MSHCELAAPWSNHMSFSRWLSTHPSPCSPLPRPQGFRIPSEFPLPYPHFHKESLIQLFSNYPIWACHLGLAGGEKRLLIIGGIQCSNRQKQEEKMGEAQCRWQKAVANIPGRERTRSNGLKVGLKLSRTCKSAPSSSWKLGSLATEYEQVPL